MTGSDPREQHLQHLRQWRVPPERDVSLGFLRDYFRKSIEKPYKQLAGLSLLWDELVPAGLAAHTRLEGLSRGVLQVAVDSSSRLYELDRLLRQGLQRELLRRHKGTALRKVQLRVAELNPPASGGPAVGAD